MGGAREAGTGGGWGDRRAAAAGEVPQALHFLLPPPLPPLLSPPFLSRTSSQLPARTRMRPAPVALARASEPLEPGRPLEFTNTLRIGGRVGEWGRGWAGEPPSALRGCGGLAAAAATAAGPGPGRLLIRQRDEEAGDWVAGGKGGGGGTLRGVRAAGGPGRWAGQGRGGAGAGGGGQRPPAAKA